MKVYPHMYLYILCICLIWNKIRIDTAEYWISDTEGFIEMITVNMEKNYVKILKQLQKNNKTR